MFTIDFLTPLNLSPKLSRTTAWRVKKGISPGVGQDYINPWPEKLKINSCRTKNKERKPLKNITPFKTTININELQKIAAYATKTVAVKLKIYEYQMFYEYRKDCIQECLTLIFELSNKHKNNKHIAMKIAINAAFKFWCSVCKWFVHNEQGAGDECN